MSVTPVPRAAVLSVLVAAIAATSCGRGPDFDTTRARSHIDTLARRIGSRAIGTPENLQAREYIVGVLRDAGFVVRLQEADAVDERFGITAHVVNVIATKDGAMRDAVALVSHYDSVPDGPGAADDALGVATCLESARVLASAGLRHSLFVLVTDGEEAGLMGARAVVADADVASRVRTFLNFDGTGAAGPTLLFETGPGWGAPLSAWAAGASSPAGASFGAEIYKRLPNDTDFTIMKTLGASGLNFAPVADSYAYHTDRDIAPRVETDTVTHEIGNTIGTVRRLDELDWGPASDSPTFFDVFGWRGVIYSPAVASVLLWSSLVLAGAAWLILTRDLWRQRRLLGLVMTALWALVSSSVSVGLAIGAASMLRRARAELNPWYASPNWFFLFLIAVGLFGAWTLHRLGARLSDRLQPIRSPAAVWWVTLPIWAAAAVLLNATAPVAAYLVVWPMLIAAALVLVFRRSAGGMLIASGVVLVVSVALWVRNTWILLRFLGPLFGWLPITAPVWLYPALIAVAALFVMPPVIAIGWGSFQRVLLSRAMELALIIAVVVTGVLAWASPAYTSLRPQMRTVWYVQDNFFKRAWWEIGGSEPSPGLGVPGPVGANWTRPSDGLPTSAAIGNLAAPFVFRTTTAPIVTASPAEITSQIARAANGQLTLEMTIVPRVPLTFSLQLPFGIEPAASTLAGTMTRIGWRATYVAPPAAGVLLRLTFDGRSAADLAWTRVVLITPGVPGQPAGSWPAWLSRERDAWHARTIVIETGGIGG